MTTPRGIAWLNGYKEKRGKELSHPHHTKEGAKWIRGEEPVPRQTQHNVLTGWNETVNEYSRRSVRAYSGTLHSYGYLKGRIIYRELCSKTAYSSIF